MNCGPRTLVDWSSVLAARLQLNYPDFDLAVLDLLVARTCVCVVHREKNMKPMTVLLSVALVSSYALAEEPDDVLKLQVAECTVPADIGARRFESLHRIADTPIIPVLNQIKALAAKARDSSLSVGEQLSGQDNARFGELRQQMIAMQTRSLVESRYDKHLELLEKMAEAADGSYRWGSEADQKSPYAAAFGALTLLEVGDPLNSYAAPTEQHCSLLWALHKQEQPSIDALNKPEIGAASDQIGDLRSRYNAPSLDRSKLSPSDQQTYDGARRILLRAKPEADNINAVEQLKTMARALDLIYATEMTDLNQSGGDPASLGATLRTMNEHGKIDQKMLMRVGLWRKLDETYPSDQVKMMEQMQKSLHPDLQSKSAK
jgi:hypothetical protein